jgi:hypothetical protein
LDSWSTCLLRQRTLSSPPEQHSSSLETNTSPDIRVSKCLTEHYIMFWVEFRSFWTLN